jgi:uncharacterized linocin/CFP29 family protein
MDDLLRSHAPITQSAWQAIDEQAKSVLSTYLAARKLVDFDGPRGWRKSAVKLGRVRALDAAPGGTSVQAAIRLVQPLVELRAPFTLPRAELDDVGRGAADPDLAPVVAAATQIARAEDQLVFHGFGAGGVAGDIERSPHAPLQIPDAYEAYPTVVADAVRVLRMAGVDGPYAIALGPRCWTGLVQAMGRGGYPVLEVVRQVVGGAVVWAPAVDGAIVLSTRGGDFALTVGQDLSIGYTRHTDSTVDFYIVESLTFRVLVPEAAVWLRYKS